MRKFNEMRQELKIAVGLVQESYPLAARIADTMIAYFERDKETLRKLLPEMELHAGELWWPDAFEIAAYHFELGDANKGFEWLEKSYSRREFGIVWINKVEMFDSVRDDPRFKSLLTKLGIG